MTKSKQRRKINWVNILLVAVLVFSCWRMCARVVRYQELKQEASVRQVELDRVRAEYDEKLDTIELLSNDAYIERLARENLGMVLPGETPVSTVRVAAPVAETQPEVNTPEGEIPADAPPNELF